MKHHSKPKKLFYQVPVLTHFIWKSRSGSNCQPRSQFIYKNGMAYPRLETHTGCVIMFFVEDNQNHLTHLKLITNHTHTQSNPNTWAYHSIMVSSKSLGHKAKSPDPKKLNWQPSIYCITHSKNKDFGILWLGRVLLFWSRWRIWLTDLSPNRCWLEVFMLKPLNIDYFGQNKHLSTIVYCILYIDRTQMGL